MKLSSITPKAGRPPVPHVTREAGRRAISASDPPDFIAEILRPWNDSTWRKAALMSLRAADGEGAASLEWLSHHPVRNGSAAADPMAQAELNLSKMDLTHDDLQRLGAWLQSWQFPAPIKIDLSYINFSNDYADDLAALLKEPSCVTELSLVRCRLSKRDIGTLCSVLHDNTSLQQLDLERNFIEGCGKRIGAMLRANTTLKSLVLRGTEESRDGPAHQLGYQSIRWIAGALEENSSLQVLDLGRNRWGFKGIAAIANMLKVNKTLSDLDLGDAPMDHGFKTLCEALASNTTLEHLKLGRADLNNGQFTALGTMLEKNRSLRSLDLSCVYFERSADKAHMQKFCKGLSSNTSLRELTIQAGRHAIFLAVLSMLGNPASHLETLGFCGNALSAQEQAALTKAVQDNRTLIHFGDGGLSNFTADAMSAINSATARNERLRLEMGAHAGEALSVLLQEAHKSGNAPYLPKEMNRPLGKAFELMNDVPTVLAIFDAVMQR